MSEIEVVNAITSAMADTCSVYITAGVEGGIVISHDWIAKKYYASCGCIMLGEVEPAEVCKTILLLKRMDLFCVFADLGRYIPDAEKMITAENIRNDTHAKI